VCLCVCVSVSVQLCTDAGYDLEAGAFADLTLTPESAGERGREERRVEEEERRAEERARA